MPELSDSLHELYDAEIHVQVQPSRGMNALTGTARAVRRRSQARAAGLGVAAVVAVGALAVGGMHAFGDIAAPAATAHGTPSAAPSDHSRPVTWNPGPEANDVMAGFAQPACGDTFAPAQATVDNVSVAAEASFGNVRVTGSSLGDPITVAADFNATDGEDRSLLASPTGFVITRDGTVVYSNFSNTDVGENIELYATGATNDMLQPAFSTFSCDARAALAAVDKKLGWDPDAPHSEAEQNSAHGKAVGKAADKVLAKYAKWPSGTYQVYLIAPVIFGEQLAAAQELKAQGAHQLAYVRSSLGDTPFAQDKRVSAYCFDTGEGWTCANVPDALLDEVLTFPVDPASIDDTPSGMAVSEPSTVTVP